MRRTLPVALAGVFATSFYAYGQLGGSNGVDIPFSGFLQDGPAAMNDSAVDFTVTVYTGAAGTLCDTVQVGDVPVVDGRFSFLIEDVDETCVKNADPHIELAVNGTALVGRQRLFPSVGAYSSGTGDFENPGSLNGTKLGDLGVSGFRGIKNAASGAYALLQSDNGQSTYLNAATGGALSFRINNAQKMSMDQNGALAVTGNTTTNSLIVGDVIASASYRGLAFSGNNSIGNYALLQSQDGIETLLNAKSGGHVHARINNATRLSVDNNGADVTGKLLRDEWQISCGEGLSGTTYPFCCRVRVRDGYAQCRRTSDTTWTSWTTVSDIFGAGGVNGPYQISCAGWAAGANYAACCRIDVTGHVDCNYNTNDNLAGGWSAGVSPW